MYPTAYSVVFTFELTFESFKDFGVCQQLIAMLIKYDSPQHLWETLK
jgi:hypothetical protein